MHARIAVVVYTCAEASMALSMEARLVKAATSGAGHPYGSSIRSKAREAGNVRDVH